MENNSNMAMVFQQMHIQKYILDYLSSTTDLFNLSNCNRFFYTIVNGYRFSRYNTGPSQFKKRLCFPIGLSQSETLNKESLICWDTNYNKFMSFNEKIIKEKWEKDGYIYDDALHVNLRFKCINGEIDKLDGVGKEIASFVDQLSEIYYDSTILKFKEFTKYIGLLKVFHVLQHLRTKRITKLDIRIWDLNTFGDENIISYIDKMYLDDGLPNLKEVFFNIQSTDATCVITKLINFLSKRHDVIFHFSFHNFIGNPKFSIYLGIIEYALKHNVKISLMECVEMEKYFLNWIRNLDLIYFDNFIELHFILCDWSLLPELLYVVSYMRNIKHFGIQFLIYSHDQAIKLKRNTFIGRIPFFDKKFNIFPRLENCKKLKKISWALPPEGLIDDNSSSRKIEVNLFNHFLNVLPNSVVSISIMNIDTITKDLTKNMAVTMPDLEFLHLVGVNHFEGGSLENFINLKYLRLTYSILPVIPNTVKLLMTNIVFEEKDNTFSYQPFNRWWCSNYYGGPFYCEENDEKVKNIITNLKIFTKHLRTDDRGLVHVFFNNLSYGHNYKKLVSY
uniref:F-box domain-containing protein n=1 Tax=Parastrongyloides trichosuri TaxID=131310 RepID=A0A0N4ZDQ2_PARTI